ncbi:MAG: DNA topoisomerase VI, partial [Methanomicrobiales archaeon]|nr:DNA topoisomerase VI [Methanomicrobiales archaeon]
MSKQELDTRAAKSLLAIADAWYVQMKEGQVPSISLPTRTKQNIAFDDETEVWKYGGRESMRSASTEKSAVHLLKMAYVIGFIRQQL